MTFKYTVCPICLKRKKCDEHHIWKRAVWGYGKDNKETKFVCLDCHHIIDEIIKKKENEILQQYTEIYAGTFNMLLAIGENGIHQEAKKYGIKPRKRKQ